MSLTSVGIYEFNAKDLIGHGAFAVVYKGRLKSVSEPFLLFYYVPVRVPLLFMENVLCECETKSGIDRVQSSVLSFVQSPLSAPL